MKYMLKRIIIGVAIGTILFIIKGGIVFAESATDVYWSSNKINGQNVVTGNLLWFDANASYNWTIENLGCSWPADDYPASCGTGECKLYIDLYFSTNMPFSNWTSTSNGFSWVQYNLGERLINENWKTNYLIKRFIYTPNQYGMTGQNTITFSRSGSISTGYVPGANYGQAFKLQSYKCGLTSDMEQLSIDDPKYQALINNTNAINNVFTSITTATTALTNAINTTNQIALETKNWAQAEAEAAQAQLNAMKDDNIEENNPQFAEFDDYVATNGVITNLITMPVTLFTKVLNTLNGSCTTYNLGSLYGTNLTLPCVVVSNYIGAPLWSVIDILISGLLIYSISRHFVKIFNKMSSLEESDIID